VKYEGVSSGLAIERPGPAVVVVRLTGWDTGEINMQTASPFIQFTAKFVQRFSDLGGIMRIYSHAAAFDAALGAAK
jgi:hypothetical protein